VSHVLRLSFLLHYSSQLMHQGSRFYHFILFFWVIGYSIVIEWCYIQRTTLSRNFTKYTFFFFVQHFNRYCVFQLSQNKKCCLSPKHYEPHSSKTTNNLHRCPLFQSNLHQYPKNTEIQILLKIFTFKKPILEFYVPIIIIILQYTILSNKQKHRRS
jgi:hypothetical protein